ncbi:peptide deformylase [bacterium]|nr:peptide deformylase [bacterium]
MKLITFPNDILREEMPDFDFENPVMDPMVLEKEMIELMIAQRGIGLSANQVGIRARVLVMFPKDLSLEMGPFAMFNPVLRAASDEQFEAIEGCLSFPKMLIPVKRSRSVMVDYLDSKGDNCVLLLSDIDAKCFLHELDHLNGICFIDRVSKLKQNLTQRKWKKLRTKYGRAQRES